MPFEIQFLGGAETVTGSKYLVAVDGRKILIDCGLFQGVKNLRLRNWEPFPVPPAEIDALILTHAHIDHSGYIPRLIKEGFRGKIFSTSATKDLARILLADSGHLMEEEAEYLNRKKKTKHDPALPLFTQKEGEQAAESFVPIGFNKVTSLGGQLSFEFKYAGHILGAAFVVLYVGEKKIIFSGDIGRLKDRIFYPPDRLPEADYLVIESTYGNRLHPDSEALDDLSVYVNETAQKNGALVIPAFAVGRAQSLMYFLAQLKDQKKIPEIPIYLNSPMASDVSELLLKYKDLHRLSEKECLQTCGVVKYIQSVEESKDLNQRKGPMIIIAGSGMLTGGRILHHLKAFAPFPQNMILLTGYQAYGTRGEALERNEHELKIHGEYFPVKARVEHLENMSAHADYKEILQWLTESKIHPQKVFVTHGEPSAADELRRRLSEAFGWKVAVPNHGDKEIL